MTRRLVRRSVPRSVRWSVRWLGRLATVIAAFAPSPSGARSQEIPDSVVQAVDRFVEQHYERLGLPGVAVSIATANEVVLAKGYGNGTLQGEPITNRTSFFLGSVTKTLTAFGVARLAEDGHIDLDGPVERFIPGFGMRAPFEPGMLTLRHLLHHRSGLSQWDGHDSVAQERGRFDHLAPTGLPGGDSEYSSLNFILLGRVVEEASGMSYGEFLDQTLFGPLGMDDAFVEGSGSRLEPRAQGHRNLFGFNVETDEPPVPPFLVPAGFASASAVDMARYTGMLLGRGAFGDRRVADSATVAALLAPMGETGPAMAWGRGRRDGTLVLGHSGNSRTSAARVRLVREDGYAISVLVNTNSGPFFDSPDALLDGIHTILDGG
ncbi:MAG: beta-lactamase family protein, partial [Gemmatimonadetes bacterium]|nr:beta-lactamase family protein [Gemmatimonadota bacterium]